jgi:hypothetical protein
MNKITGNGLTGGRINYLHKRLSKKYGKAIKCEMCGSEGRSKYEWALKKGRGYSDNQEDYMQLCCSCHRTYDYTQDQKKKMSAAKKGKPKFGNQLKFVQIGIDSRKRCVMQYSLEGIFIKEWDTASDASRQLCISQSSIVMNLKNKYKTSGGYIWKYKN